MAKTLIHINRAIIDANRKHGTRHPVITVKQGRKNRYAQSVQIEGPSRVVYQPDDPLSCGAKVWIESESPVTLVGEAPCPLRKAPACPAPSPPAS